MMMMMDRTAGRSFSKLKPPTRCPRLLIHTPTLRYVTLRYGTLAVGVGVLQG